MDLHFEFIFKGYILIYEVSINHLRNYLSQQIFNIVKFILLINYIFHLILDKFYHSMQSVYKI